MIKKSILILVVCLFYGCQSKPTEKKVADKTENKIETNVDSIELTNLIREVYEWHESKRLDDFPYKFEEQQDSIFTGIDWKKYQSNIELFKQTDFFTRDFLLKHQSIALSLDSSIKKTDISWRNLNDGIPIWDVEYDTWCYCQDSPDNYWKILTIDSLTIKGGYADFNWNWGGEYPHNSKVTARKEDGKWKINSLEGFNYFQTVEGYDKWMKEQ